MTVESATVPSDIHTVVALDDTDQKIVALWLAQRPRTTLTLTVSRSMSGRPLDSPGRWMPPCAGRYRPTG
jgi:hypothetical protein